MYQVFFMIIYIYSTILVSEQANMVPLKFDAHDQTDYSTNVNPFAVFARAQ